jgi:hypothetical protein
MQLVAQFVERVHQRLSARYHHRFGWILRGTAHYFGNLDRRMGFRIPRFLRVAPPASHVAPSETDKVRRAPRMRPFALQGVKILDQRQL